MNLRDLHLRPEPLILRRVKFVKNILLVGKEEHQRMLLAALLAEEGHAVSTCSSGDVALGMIQDGAFEFVIVDHSKPELDGIDLLENIKQLNPALPVLIVSADYEVEPYINAMNLGAVDYFAKPIDYVEIQRIVNNYDSPRSIPERRSFHNEQGC